jgi:hypothetical protein
MSPSTRPIGRLLRAMPAAVSSRGSDRLGVSCGGREADAMLD